jgi:hypothetical protein
MNHAQVLKMYWFLNNGHKEQWLTPHDTEAGTGLLAMHITLVETMDSMQVSRSI